MKEVLQRAANPADPVFRGVHGLVADAVPGQRRGGAVWRLPWDKRPSTSLPPAAENCSTICGPNRTGSAAASASSGSTTKRQGVGSLSHGKIDERLPTPLIDLADSRASWGRADRFVETPANSPRWPSDCWGERGSSRSWPTPFRWPARSAQA